MDDLLKMIRDNETIENFIPTNKIVIDFDTLIVPDNESRVNYDLVKIQSDSSPDLSFVLNKELTPMQD